MGTTELNVATSSKANAKDMLVAADQNVKGACWLNDNVATLREGC